MGFLLDMKTILITLVAGHLFTVIMLSAYWRQYPKDMTLSTFFSAKCVQAVAWLMLVLRNGISDVFTISFANSLLFIGTALETAALLKLLQSYTLGMRKLYVMLTAVSIAGFHLVMLIDNQERLRIAEASIATALFIVIPAYRLFTRKASAGLQWILGSLYSLVIVSLVGRGIAAAGWTHPPMGLFTPGIFQSLSFLALYLVMIVGNTGFVLLLKEQVDEELVRIASYDDLTGTLNRRTFILRAIESLSEHAGRRQPLSMVLFDIDHFKMINDKHGHDVGDRVLQQLTRRLQALLEPGERFGRYGGDEFAILLPAVNEGESDRRVELLRTAAETVVVPELAEALTISLGVVTLVPDERTELEAVYKLCDRALYEAKGNGRNGAARLRMAAS